MKRVKSNWRCFNCSCWAMDRCYRTGERKGYYQRCKHFEWRVEESKSKEVNKQ
jgi:hypothetical protein